MCRSRPLNKDQEQKANKVNDKGTREAYEKLFEKFRGDVHSTNEFMHKPNPELRGKSPLTMVGEHNTAELNNYIDQKRKRYY